MGIQSIIDYFDAIGCAEVAIDNALISLLEAGLIEPYNVSSRDLSSNQKLAISYKGMAHLRLASHNSVFFYQMALTTAITDKDAACKIRSLYKSNESPAKISKAIISIFLDYLFNSDKQYISIESHLDQYNCQNELISNLKNFTQTPISSVDNLVAIHGSEYKEGIIKKEIIVTVDYYDTSKRFGFAEAEGIDSRIFIHAEKLNKYGINTIKDGDEILCDLARGPKGIFIKKSTILKQTLVISILLTVVS